MSTEDNGISQIPVTSSQPAEQPAPAGAAGERGLFTPPIDIYETEEGLVLVADLPGVSVRTLDLQVQDNKLTLLGRVANPAPTNARLLHKEYEEGDFLRSFILSENVDHERVTARLNNGVLEVVLPHETKSTPRRIQVNTD
ncbi:MAG: Hsp20/alpha crystallin family protein [Deltaproteobacteria bacterium]